MADRVLAGAAPPCLLFGLGVQAVLGSSGRNPAMSPYLLPLEQWGSASPSWAGRVGDKHLEKQEARLCFLHRPREAQERWGSCSLGLGHPICTRSSEAVEEASPGTLLLGTQTTQKALQWPRWGCQPWAEVSAGEQQVLPFLSAITRELTFLVQERICGPPLSQIRFECTEDSSACSRVIQAIAKCIYKHIFLG